MDLAISSMSGTSQPNLNSVVHSLRNAPRSTKLDVDSFNQLSSIGKRQGQYYTPFDSSPFGSAEVFEHQMPGGQYTNLREQAGALGLGKDGLMLLKHIRK